MVLNRRRASAHLQLMAELDHDCCLKAAGQLVRRGSLSC